MKQKVTDKGGMVYNIEIGNILMMLCWPSIWLDVEDISELQWQYKI